MPEVDGAGWSGATALSAQARDTDCYVGVDVGGSGIKAGVVDLVAGSLAGDRVRIDTPSNFAFEAVVETIATTVAAAGAATRVGVGFPAVVAHGVVKSPPTAHEFGGWVGRSIADAVAVTTGCAVTVLNDADAAGTAELHYGAGRDADGVVIVVTLGTGVGTAVFVDGTLVPNTEFGKLHLAGREDVAEQRVSDRVRGAENLAWDEYGRRLHEYLALLDKLFTPDLVIIGGGVSKKHAKYLDQVDIRATVVPAELRNQAGIVGAARAAAEAAR